MSSRSMYSGEHKRPEDPKRPSLGTGMAERAAKTVEKTKEEKKKRLDEIMKEMK
jgi:hypothetical protein